MVTTPRTKFALFVTEFAKMLVALMFAANVVVWSTLLVLSLGVLLEQIGVVSPAHGNWSGNLPEHSRLLWSQVVWILRHATTY